MAVTASPSSSKRKVPARRANKQTRRQGKDVRSPEIGITGDIPTALAELLALEDQDWVVSCYQKLEPKDRADAKFRIALKNRIRRAEDRLQVLGFPHGEREQVTAQLERIYEYFLNTSNLDGSRGVAVFSGKGWVRAVRVPHVLRSRVLVDRTPVVGELVALTETGTRVLVALVDRRHARLFVVDTEGVTEFEALVDNYAPPVGKFRPDKNAPGEGEYRFHSRIREEKHRHLAHVAEEMARVFRQRGFDGVVIGGIGNDQEALLPYLPTELRDKYLGAIRVAPKKVSAAEIRDQAMELWAESAEHQAADVVGELDGLHASGWSTSGVEPTLQALFQGQVRTLVVDHDAVVPGFRFSESGRLSTQSAGLKSEGEPVPVADVIDDAIEDALRQRSRVAVARNDLAGRFDQLAAVLRFRIQPK